VDSSWSRLHVTSDHFFMRPFTTLTSMLLYITPDMCAGFVRATVRRYLTIVP